jgi:hypothetical protein
MEGSYELHNATLDFIKGREFFDRIPKILHLIEIHDEIYGWIETTSTLSLHFNALCANTAWKPMNGCGITTLFLRCGYCGRIGTGRELALFK